MGRPRTRPAAPSCWHAQVTAPLWNLSDGVRQPNTSARITECCLLHLATPFMYLKSSIPHRFNRHTSFHPFHSLTEPFTNCPSCGATEASIGGSEVEGASPSLLSHIVHHLHVLALTSLPTDDDLTVLSAADGAVPALSTQPDPTDPTTAPKIQGVPLELVRKYRGLKDYLSHHYGRVHPIIHLREMDQPATIGTLWDDALKAYQEDTKSTIENEKMFIALESVDDLVKTIEVQQNAFNTWKSKGEKIRKVYSMLLRPLERIGDLAKEALSVTPFAPAGVIFGASLFLLKVSPSELYPRSFSLSTWLPNSLSLIRPLSQAIVKAARLCKK
jgi:fungal STAND N-terminal Goodbye domain